MALPKANATPELFAWARATAGLTLAEAAKKLGVKEERLESWERGQDRPTVRQLRKLAQVYKRPVSVFYLPQKPVSFQVMRDLRRLPGTGLRKYSPELLYEMRLAQQRRELAIELLEDLGERPASFSLRGTLDYDTEKLGVIIREALGVTYTEQCGWRSSRAAFNAWREKLENFGVLVFQITRVDSEEASGFALAEEVLPVVAVNRKDVWGRRVFSLLHEFVHLILRVTGASDLDVDASRPPEDARVEVFCNSVAAATLMPQNQFVAEAVIRDAPSGAIEWTDAAINELAERYGVSREAVVRRLLTLKRTTAQFYERKRAQYSAEYEARKKAERENSADKAFKRNPARDAVLDSGRTFVRLVLNNYYQENITLSDVSGYLGVRIKHVPRIEAALGVRST